MVMTTPSVKQIRTEVEKEIDRPDEIAFQVTFVPDRVLQADDYSLAKSINNDAIILWSRDAEE